MFPSGEATLESRATFSPNFPTWRSHLETFGVNKLILNSFHSKSNKMNNLTLQKAEQNLNLLIENANTNCEPTLITNLDGKKALLIPFESGSWSSISSFLLNLFPQILFNQNPKHANNSDAIRSLYGKYKNSLSDSNKFAEEKQFEIEIEEQKWKR